MLRSHAALMRLRAEPVGDDPFAPERLSGTVPPKAAVRNGTVVKARKGAKGLEFLASPPEPPG